MKKTLQKYGCLNLRRFETTADVERPVVGVWDQWCVMDHEPYVKMTPGEDGEPEAQVSLLDLEHCRQIVRNFAANPDDLPCTLGHQKGTVEKARYKVASYSAMCTWHKGKVVEWGSHNPAIAPPTEADLPRPDNGGPPDDGNYVFRARVTPLGAQVVKTAAVGKTSPEFVMQGTDQHARDIGAQALGLAWTDDVQVIAPMYRGECGVLLAPDGALAQLGDHAPAAQTVAREFGHGGRGLRHRPFQFEQPVARRVAVLDQAARVVEVLVEQALLAAPGRHHAVVGLQDDFLALDAFLDRLQVRTQRRAPRSEQLLLVVHLGADQRIAGGGHQVGVKADRGGARLLGKQPALDGALAEVALARCLVVGARHGVVEAEQHLPLLHHLAFAHVDLLDDAARQVLHGLALGVQRHQTGAGHAFVQRRESRPQQEAAESQQQGPQADAGGAPRVGRRLAGFERVDIDDGRHARLRRPGCTQRVRGQAFDQFLVAHGGLLQ